MKNDNPNKADQSEAVNQLLAHAVKLGLDQCVIVAHDDDEVLQMTFVAKSKKLSGDLYITHGDPRFEWFTCEPPTLN